MAPSLYLGCGAVDSISYIPRACGGKVSFLWCQLSAVEELKIYSTLGATLKIVAMRTIQLS